MLDTDILGQVKSVFSDLLSQYVFDAYINPEHQKARDFKIFLEEISQCSDHIKCNFHDTDKNTIEFSILKDGEETGISFRAIPTGHEFTSLLLAVLNADGKGKNLPDEAIRRRIEALKAADVRIKTYVSLTCTNCPDVVQALNVITLFNKNIKHEMIDGALFQDEVSKLNIQAVPSVYVNDESFHIGKSNLGELLHKLEAFVGTEFDAEKNKTVLKYDIVVLGGGPAGASAAIYSARKGLKVAVVAERVGGQVNDTTDIENIVSVPHTTGTSLASDLKEHMLNYNVDIFENRQIVSASLADKTKSIATKGGEVFEAPAVVIATGAGWRRLNVDDESKYIGHGVHFCPHCDGPFYKGKSVAVIGGGNSGLEAAIDLAGICKHVSVFEFADACRADTVLLDKAGEMDNIEIFTSSQTTHVTGDGGHLASINVKDLKTEKEREIKVDGIFVQIGLVANTRVFEGQLELSPRREIPVDEHCRTALKGVYAAGDVTTVPYKQIVIAMGEGAKAALSAFEDRMKGVI